MRCQAKDCGREFTPEQIVFVVKTDEGMPVNCCSEECAKKTEEALRQGDMFSNRELLQYITERTESRGCHIAGAALAPSKDGIKKVVKIELPYDASLDRLAAFGMDQVAVAIFQERLESLPDEMEADDVADNKAPSLKHKKKEKAA